MKILVIQENGRHDRNRNFRECFCTQRALNICGIACDVWGKGHSNFNSKIDFNSYDVIIDLENYDTKWIPDLSLIKAYKILWAIDGHCRGMKCYMDRFISGKYDLILQASRDLVDDNSIWFPNCFDDSLIFPMNVAKRADVGFCGNTLNRKNYLDLLSLNFNYIGDIFVIGEDMVRAINSYRIHFNKNISFDINYRNFETIGCQIPLVTNFNIQYEILGFKDGKNCILYNSTEEMIDKIKYGLENVDYLEKIALSGKVLSKEHTYLKRMIYLEEILKDKAVL